MTRSRGVKINHKLDILFKRRMRALHTINELELATRVRLIIPIPVSTASFGLATLFRTLKENNFLFVRYPKVESKTPLSFKGDFGFVFVTLIAKRT